MGLGCVEALVAGVVFGSEASVVGEAAVVPTIAIVLVEDAVDSAAIDEGSPAEPHAAATTSNGAHHETRMAHDR